MHKKLGFLILILGGLGFFIYSDLYAAERSPWYITAGPTYIIPDSDRNANNAVGLKIGVGKELSPSTRFELSGLSHTLERKSGPLAFKHKGLSADGIYLFRPSARLVPYGVFGIGALKSEFENAQETRAFFQGGLGLMVPLGRRVSLRGDWRLRFEREMPQGSGGSLPHYTDQIVSVDMVFHFGTQRPPVVVGDRDKDGVSDDQDRCPDTPAGVKVDKQGCEDKTEAPTLQEQIEKSDSIILKGIEFDTGSDAIRPDSEPVLNAAAEALKRYPKIVVEVSGHTDNEGSAELNKTLSEARAKSVSRALIEKGVAATRLIPKGYGSEKPIADNNTSEGRAKNRRVEFNILQR